MKKNYYDELIEEIEQLIKEDKKELALKKIKEELSLPYVPKLYEEKLFSFLNQIGYQEQDKNQKKSIFSREELLTIMNEYRKHDIDFLFDISNGFEQYNWVGYEKDIETILNYDDLDNKVKALIYNNLVIQNLNYDFRINQLIINPIKNKTSFETLFALKNLEAIQKKDFEDPSLREMCQKLLFLYIMNKFPNSMFIEYEDISEQLLKISQVMIGQINRDELSAKENALYEIINGKKTN